MFWLICFGNNIMLYYVQRNKIYLCNFYIWYNTVIVSKVHTIFSWSLCCIFAVLGVRFVYEDTVWFIWFECEHKFGNGIFDKIRLPFLRMLGGRSIVSVLIIWELHKSTGDSGQELIRENIWLFDGLSRLVTLFLERIETA